MKKIIILSISLFTSLAFAQKEDLAIYGGFQVQEVANKKLPGGLVNVRYYLGQDFSLGGDFSYQGKKFKEGFGFHTDRTHLSSIMINVNAQYDFVKNDKFMLGGYLSNGLQLASLRNLNDITVTEQYDEEGNPYYNETAKLLHRDAFYVLTPGIDLSVKLVEIDEADKVGLYLTTRTGYQMAIGKDRIANASNPSNLVWSVGITIKGSTISLEK